MSLIWTLAQICIIFKLSESAKRLSWASHKLQYKRPSQGPTQLPRWVCLQDRLTCQRCPVNNLSVITWRGGETTASFQNTRWVDTARRVSPAQIFSLGGEGDVYPNARHSTCTKSSETAAPAANAPNSQAQKKKVKFSRGKRKKKSFNFFSKTLFR